MSSRAKRADPALWDRVKAETTKSDKGGRPGQWSARKAQFAVQAYKGEGGRYIGERRKDNSLTQWTEEDWGTRSGRRSRDSGERYLPKQAREELSENDYARTTQKKRRDTRKGLQFSRQPDDIARRTANHRAPRRSEPTKAALYEDAKSLGIAGRSRMSRNELARAITKARP